MISCMVICLYFGLHAGYCFDMSKNLDGSINIAEFTGMLSDNIFHPVEFLPFNSGILLLFLITGMIICMYIYSDYLRMKNTMRGREHGSAAWNTNYARLLHDYVMSPKILNKAFPWKKYKTVKAPGGRTLCKKHRFSEAEVAECKRQSQLYSENVALSQDTTLTQLNLNAIVFGGSGAGKSRFFVMPNLLQANSSYVVTDPSGELMAGTAKYLESQGYTIKCLNLEHMDRSCRYNPFAYVREDADLLIMINALINNIEGPKKGGGGDGKFWDETSQTLLTAVCGYLFEVCDEDNEYLYVIRKDGDGNDVLDEDGRPVPEVDENGDPVLQMRQKKDSAGRTVVGEDGNPVMEKVPNPHWKGCRNFTNVLRLLNMADVSDERAYPVDDLDKLFYDLEISNPGSYAVSQYKVIKQAGTGKTAQNIIISTTAIFARYFMLDKINNLTYTDEIHLEEVGQKKCALFIVTPQGDKTYNFLASMLYTQLFATLYHQGEENAAKRGTTSVKVDVPVRCLIDEAANIGVIPQFSEKLATMRKYGISACPIYQNQAQIKVLLKDAWETIVGNCDTMLFLGGIDSSTVKMVSDRLGKGTIKSDSSSVSKGAKGSYSQSNQKIGRELMTTTEIEQMRNDHCITFIRSMKPFNDYKYPLEKHPAYKYSGMADDRNSYSAPWRLTLDKKLLRRAAVRKYDSPEYIMPALARGVTQEESDEAARRIYKQIEAMFANAEMDPADAGIRIPERFLTKPAGEGKKTESGNKEEKTFTLKDLLRGEADDKAHDIEPVDGSVKASALAKDIDGTEEYEDITFEEMSNGLRKNLESTALGRALLEKMENTPGGFM